MNERQLIINKALEQVGYLGKRSNKKGCKGKKYVKKWYI